MLCLLVVKLKASISCVFKQELCNNSAISGTIVAFSFMSGELWVIIGLSVVLFLKLWVIIGLSVVFNSLLGLHMGLYWVWYFMHICARITVICGNISVIVVLLCSSLWVLVKKNCCTILVNRVHLHTI